MVVGNGKLIIISMQCRVMTLYLDRLKILFRRRVKTSFGRSVWPSIFAQRLLYVSSSYS